ERPLRLLGVRVGTLARADSAEASMPSRSQAPTGTAQGAIDSMATTASLF
ncbi:MAG: DNA polymerase IV, partial [Comamonadaceae bacterium]